MNINGLGLTDTATSSSANPDKLRESARQFEALLIGQMLKSVADEGKKPPAKATELEPVEPMLPTATALLRDGTLGLQLG